CAPSAGARPSISPRSGRLPAATPPHIERSRLPRNKATLSPQQPESVIAAPAVYLEIVIQGEDVASADLAGQMNQTGIGQVNLLVPVLVKKPFNFGRRGRKAKGNLKNVSGHVLENGFRRSVDSAEQMAAFRDDRFHSDQRTFPRTERSHDGGMRLLRVVEHRHDGARIEQGGLQRPKSSRYFLLVARSGIPEENLPIPIIRSAAETVR